MKFKISYCLYLAVIIAISLFVGCSDRKPLSNTVAYKSAHGLKPVGTNAIKIGETIFHLTESDRFDVHTSGEIQPGIADVLTIYLDGKSQTDNGANDTVRVEYRYIDSNSKDSVNKTTQVFNWNEYNKKSNTHGLVEYRSNEMSSGWGKVVYSVNAGQGNNPLDQDLRFNCNANSEFIISMCWLNFTLNRNLNI